jgi:hypothetical protein
MAPAKARHLDLTEQRLATGRLYAVLSDNMHRSVVSNSSTGLMGEGPSIGAFGEKVNMATFAEKFCARHNLDPEKYEAVAFKRALYPAARWLRPVLVLKADYFAADREFIRGVGRLTRSSNFDSEAQNFLYHPNNRGFLRHVFKLRASVRRLSRMVRDLM